MPPKSKKTSHQKDGEEQEIDIVTLSTKDAAEIIIEKTQTVTDNDIPTTAVSKSVITAPSTATKTTVTVTTAAAAAPIQSTSSTTTNQPVNKEVSELLQFFDKLTLKSTSPPKDVGQPSCSKTFSSSSPLRPSAPCKEHTTEICHKDKKYPSFYEQYPTNPTQTDTSEMDGVLLPKPFTGLPGEDVESWMLHLLAYCEYKDLPDKKRMELAVILMRGAASDWLQTVEKKNENGEEEGTFATFDELMNAAAKRFGRSDLIKHKTAKELFDTKQKSDESVETYVAAQNKRAAYLGKEGESMALYAVLSGLKPSISTFVAQKQPKTMSELLEAARLAEITTVKSTDEAPVMQKLAELQQEMQKLSTKFNTVAPIKSSSPDRRVSFRDQRSPSPRPDYTQRRYRQQPEWRPQQHRSPGYQPRSFPARQQRAWSTSSATPRYPVQGQNNAVHPAGQPECTRCARRHDNPQLCPAINQSCRYCNKIGHHMVKCRAWLRNCNAQKAQSH